MPAEQPDRQNCGWWRLLACRCRSERQRRFSNSSAPVRVMCRKDLRALSRAPKNRQHRFVSENLPRKEIGNVRRQFHRSAVLALCTRRNKKDLGFFAALERRSFFPPPMERRRRREFRAG